MNEELKPYVSIVNMIAKTFGKNCEVVLYDLSVPEGKVAYVVNPWVSGQEQSAVDQVVRDLLMAKVFDDDYKVNYFANMPKLHHIKSSVAFIRNRRNAMIGALCIHFDTKQLQEMVSCIQAFLCAEADPVQEPESCDHLMTMVDGLIDQLVAPVEVARLRRREKIVLLQHMEHKGIFLMKGSVEKVAEKLKISKVTVYSYLDEIKKRDSTLP